MIPIDFDGSNTVVTGPAGSEMQPLCCFRAKTPEGAVLTVSRWKFTAEEFEEAMRTKTVWLCVLSAGQVNPAFITGKRPEELPAPTPAPTEDGA